MTPSLAERNRAHAIGFDSQWMPEPMSGCWLWFGYHDRKGYGRVCVGGMVVLTHRVSWSRERGPIPDGLSVLHKCDNPACINPEHLFLGTRADNVADMIKKGRDRHLTGAAHKNARLTAEQVRAIRNDPRPQMEIAASYGVKQPQISLIKRRLSWRNLP